MSDTQVKQEGSVLTVERVFDAPRDVVFTAYTDGEALSQWWGPTGWTTPVSKMDFTVGGQWHYMMKGPDDGSEWANMESWGIMTYKEINPPSSFVATDAFTDETGVPNADMPISTTTFDFFEEGAKTRVLFTTTYPTDADLQAVIDMGMIEGMTQTLDRLDIYLANK